MRKAITRVGFTIAGELLGTALWSMIDEQFVADNRDWFFVVGLAIAVLVYFSDRFKLVRRDHVQLAPPGAADGALAEPGRRRRNLVPLYKALHWIAKDSVWAEEYAGDDGQWVVALRGAFQRALSLGEVTAFGYRQISVWVLEGGLSKLEPEFWSDAQLDISHISAFHPPRQANKGPLRYDFIEVDFDEVKAAFPPRSRQARDERRSPVERIGYDEMWATQDANYGRALINARLTPGERFYREE